MQPVRFIGSVPPGGSHDATATGDGWLGQTAPETQGAIQSLSQRGGQTTSQPQAPYLPPSPANVITGSSWVSQGSPDTRRATERLSPPIGGPAVAGQQRVQPSRAPTNQSDAYGQQRANENSRGFLASKNLEKLSEEQPDLLEPYARYFNDAAGPEDDAAVAERLARTNPNFRRDVWPLIVNSQ